jgi:hypothetical protein
LTKGDKGNSGKGTENPVRAIWGTRQRKISCKWMGTIMINMNKLSL